jgi:hypothetical protein
MDNKAGGYMTTKLFLLLIALVESAKPCGGFQTLVTALLKVE